MSLDEQSEQVVSGRRQFLRAGFAGAGLLGVHELSLGSASAFCWPKRKRRLFYPAPAPAPVYIPQAAPVAPAAPASGQSAPRFTTGSCPSQWCPYQFISHVGTFWNYEAVFCDPNGNPTSETRGMSLSNEAATPLGCSPSNCNSCSSSFAPRAKGEGAEGAARPKIAPQDQIFGVRNGKPLPEIGTAAELPPSDTIARDAVPARSLTSYANYVVDVRGKREIRLYLIHVTPTRPGAKPFTMALGEQVQPSAGAVVPVLDPSHYTQSAAEYLIWVTPPGSTVTYNVILSEK
jgi:hypothetical protein